MSKEKDYGLWEYMSEQHGLTLLGSEIHDILELARQEIELPDEDEIEMHFLKDGDKIIDAGFTHSECSLIIRNRIAGAKWALDKVRNPYPKQINP